MDIRKGKQFSWDGNDECDTASGFGKFACDGATLRGRIYIHDGDDRLIRGEKISREGRVPVWSNMGILAYRLMKF